MSQNSFCPECHKLVPVRIENREEITLVRGLPITANHPVSICTVCSAEFATADQMAEGLANTYRVYREQAGVIKPQDIIQLRKRYNASQKVFGIILGFGELTINTYEQGSLPSEAHQKILESAKNVAWFNQQFIKAKNKLGQTQIKRIEQALASLTNNTIMPGLNTNYELSPDLTSLVCEEETEYTGWVKPRSEKIFAMMAYILTHVHTVYKMKLLKILFYADFAHYQESSHAISGWPYARLPYGPVPQDYEALLFQAYRLGIVIAYPDKEERGDVYSVGPQVNPELMNQLNLDELATLEKVCKKLGTVNASHLSNLTHNEDAWLKTEHAACISYDHALTLKAVK